MFIFSILQVKGRVGVYKFLQLPYDPIGLDSYHPKQEFYFDESCACASPTYEATARDYEAVSP
jgi:hypothetical protein